MLHMAVTIIWYVLSIIFSFPYFIIKIASDRGLWLFIWISAYLLLGMLIYHLWKRVLQK